MKRPLLVVAVARGREANIPIALATIRIVMPGQDGFLNQILDCNPDALLVRNLAAIGFFRDKAPHLPLIGDYALNIANELTAQIFAEQNLVRMVPSYDLNWRQLAAMLSRSDASSAASRTISATRWRDSRPPLLLGNA